MISILLVEDDKAGAVATKTFLELSGHSVAAAASAEEALSLVGRQRFDLVITDLGLPGVGGEELPGRLRSAGLSAPVIALSGRRPRPEAPFAAYLKKPCLPKKLLATVESLLPQRAARS